MTRRDPLVEVGAANAPLPVDLERWLLSLLRHRVDGFLREPQQFGVCRNADPLQEWASSYSKRSLRRTARRLLSKATKRVRSTARASRERQRQRRHGPTSVCLAYGAPPCWPSPSSCSSGALDDDFNYDGRRTGQRSANRGGQVAQRRGPMCVQSASAARRFAVLMNRYAACWTILGL